MSCGQVVCRDLTQSTYWAHNKMRSPSGDVPSRMTPAPYFSMSLGLKTTPELVEA